MAALAARRIRRRLRHHGAAVLRAGLRIFWGAGPAPRSRPGEEVTTGEGEEPEIRGPQRVQPPVMTTVPALLLILAAASGCLPTVASALAHGAAVFTDPNYYTAAVIAGTDAPPATPAPTAD
ncbi:hypothetical protein [Streptomyces atratus]|uniref:hypothetical protein n=1 Tax=Streptomyces atratus TaxID=1893 RepID=UPI0036581AFF